MYTQVTYLGNRFFCVVFRLQKDGPQIVDKYSAEVSADLREWLAQNDYPMSGVVLRERHGANLAHSHYIKPHATDRYFRVHDDDHIEEIDANQFDTPLWAPDGF